MSVSDEINQLSGLHRRGVLSDEEFERAKQRVLDGQTTPRMGAPLMQALNGLHRSTSDRWIGGVCGGLARTSGVASWIWRLLFAFGVVFAGTGLLLYILMWVLVPLEPLYLPAPRDPARAG